MPQKKFFGNAISEEVENCRMPLDALAAVEAALAALEESLQAERKPAGSAAARPVPRTDRTNSRRVSRKKWGSFERDLRFAASVVLNEISVLCPVSVAGERIVKRLQKNWKWSRVPGSSRRQHATGHHVRPQGQPCHLLRTHCVEHLPQSVGGGLVDHIAVSGIGGFVKEKFAAAVAVGVNGVDQVQLRSHVEVEAISHSRIQLMEVAVDVGACDQHDFVLQRRRWEVDCAAGSWWRQMSIRTQDQHWLVTAPQIESAHLRVFEDGRRRFGRWFSGGWVRSGRLRRDLSFGPRVKVGEQLSLRQIEHLLAAIVFSAFVPFICERVQFGPVGIGNRRDQLDWFRRS